MTGEPWAGPAQLLPGGVVLVGGLAVLDLCRAMQAAERAARGNGIVPPARWGQLSELLTAAAEQGRAAARGSAEVPQIVDLPPSAPELIDTREAAKMLGCGPRNVRDLARRGVLATGRQVAGRLLLDRLEVEAEVTRRAAQHAARPADVA